jgi:hypothetical protein
LADLELAELSDSAVTVWNNAGLAPRLKTCRWDGKPDSSKVIVGFLFDKIRPSFTSAVGGKTKMSWRGIGAGDQSLWLDRGGMVFLNPEAVDAWSTFVSPEGCESQRCFVIRTLAHEFGHVLGLGHPDSSSCTNIMDSAETHAVDGSPCTTPAPVALGPADVKGLTRLYPSGHHPHFAFSYYGDQVEITFVSSTAKAKHLRIVCFDLSTRIQHDVATVSLDDVTRHQVDLKPIIVSAPRLSLPARAELRLYSDGNDIECQELESTLLIPQRD